MQRRRVCVTAYTLCLCFFLSGGEMRLRPSGDDVEFREFMAGLTDSELDKALALSLEDSKPPVELKCPATLAGLRGKWRSDGRARTTRD